MSNHERRYHNYVTTVLMYFMLIHHCTILNVACYLCLNIHINASLQSYNVAYCLCSPLMSRSLKWLQNFPQNTLWR